MPNSPLEAHTATPRELRDRIAAERRAIPFLVYRTGHGEQAILELRDAGGRVTIGRRPSNELVVDWDVEVSRTHAALERIGDDWVVVDDGLSHNGTYVNGRRVTTRRRLRNGDTITIGGTAIAFCSPAAAGSSTSTDTAIRPHVGELLTQRQRRVLIALCRPYRDATYATPATNQQIADELVVSVDAVKSALRALFEVYGIDHLPQNKKRASLAAEAMRSGVISRREL